MVLGWWLRGRRRSALDERDSEDGRLYVLCYMLLLYDTLYAETETCNISLLAVLRKCS